MDSRIDELCELIGKEKDLQRVQELNRELQRLLGIDESEVVGQEKKAG